MSKPWYDKSPRVYEKELQAYNEAGLKYKIDEAARTKGVLQIDFKIDPDNNSFSEAKLGETLELQAVYPFNYPYFRPQVYASGLNLPRHQHPINKNLCLLGRSTILWDSGLTVPDLVRMQLPEVLVKGNITDPNIIQNDPGEQGEPISEFYAGAENPVLFDPSIFPETDLENNNFTLLANIKFGIEVKHTFPSRLAVLESTLTSTNKSIKTVNDFIKNHFVTPIQGQIYNLPEPPPGDATELIEWLRERIKEQDNKFTLKKVTTSVGASIVIHSVIGLCFPEEKEKGVWGYGWLFHIDGIVKNRNGEGKRLPNKKLTFYSRGSDISAKLISHRAPKLAPLVNKKVSIAGLGALGGFIAIELARSGVNFLNLLDHDAVDAATTVRWPLGIPTVGNHKAHAIKEFLDQHYPGKTIEAFRCVIGDFRPIIAGQNNSLPTEPVLLEQFADGSSLIIDATAEYGVHHFLSQFAKERGIPYISLFATPGVYGGSIMRQIPGKGGCWSCFTHMEEDGTLLKLHVDDEKGLIQPPGCGDLTFTGASVDLQQISLMATKLAISTLCAGEAEGYPPVDWDITRVNLFSEAGEFIVPDWKMYDLPVHAACYYCN